MGSVTSQVAILTVMDTAPFFTSQPLDQTVYAGTDASFTTTAEGSLPLSWQWLFNAVPIPEATNSHLLLQAVMTNQTGGYSVLLTNALGSVTSQVAVLTVAPLLITLQPNSQAIHVGSNVTFTAAATGVPPFAWQWQVNGVTIPPATNSSLTLTAVTTNAAGAYSVIVRNAYGSVTSANAVLIVQVPTVSYVWQNSPFPTPPYTNWATAARAIQDAVDVVIAGSQIVVTNGSYSGGLTIETPLTLLSVNGPQNTVIDGGGNNYCVFSQSNALSLSGFTLTRGNGGLYGSAIYSSTTNAFLTNCVISSNTNDYANLGAVRNCTLYDCALTGNSVVGAAYSTLYHCTLTSNGYGADGSTLYSCALAGNSGSGASGSTLYNCTLIGNGSDGADFSTLYNCTLSGNGHSGPYFGVCCSTLNNCIIFYNSLQNYINCTLNNCCTTPMPTNGVGNITNAPLFIDQANEDFDLQATSPCINAGNNALVSGASDFDGNPRIVGGTVDIGAYEFQAPTSVISYAWLQQYGLPTDGSADFVDTDHDGMNNWQEWVCGTNPTNKLSVLCMLSAAPTTTNVSVSWQSVAGVNYFLARSTNLTSPFILQATNIVGQAGTTAYTDTNATGAGPFFYRAGVKYR
jgi:hypothetical protein